MTEGKEIHGRQQPQNEGVEKVTSLILLGKGIHKCSRTNRLRPKST